jgi:hypothetical protein
LLPQPQASRLAQCDDCLFANVVDRWLHLSDEIFQLYETFITV